MFPGQLCNCWPYGNFGICDVGEWNVFVQGRVRLDFCPEKKKEIYRHLAVSCFKHARCLTLLFGLLLVSRMPFETIEYGDAE